MAEIEGSASTVEAPISNMSAVLHSVEDWSAKTEHDLLKHDIEQLKLQQQVEAARLGAERAFANPDR